MKYKGISYELILVDLENNAQNSPEYLNINPSGQVPALVIADKETITESLAIIKYLEQNHRNNPLGLDNIHAVELASLISGIQTLQNSGALKRLSKYTGSMESANHFAKESIEKGFTAYEAILKRLGSGNFSVGASLSIADLFLIPQAYNAEERFGINLSQFPRVKQIYEHCLSMECFKSTHPDKFPKPS